MTADAPQVRADVVDRLASALTRDDPGGPLEVAAVIVEAEPTEAETDAARDRAVQARKNELLRLIQNARAGRVGGDGT